MKKNSASIGLFLLGLGANLYTQVIGYITFSELALLFFGPYFVLRFWNSLEGTRGKVLLVLSGVWLFSAMVADFCAGSALPLALRGWARPLFIGAAVIFAYQLMRDKPKRAQWFFLGYALSSAISIYIFKPGSIDVIEQFRDIKIVGSFERQIIPIVTSGMQFLFFRYGGKFPTWTALAAVGLGMMSIFFGSRSSGAVVAMTGVVSLLVHWVLPMQNGQYKMNAQKMILFGVMLVLGASFVFISYSVAAREGLLGMQAYEKYNAQEQSKLGLIFGGRSEAIGGILAVKDRPLVGHGSWPIDYKGYTQDAADLAGLTLDKETQFALQHGYVRIPAHSHLLEAWVEHGLLASLFWWYVIYLMGRLAVKSIFRFPDLFAAAVLLLLQKSWDIFFSPIGGRVALAATLAFFAALADAADRADKVHTASQRLRNGRRYSPQNLAPNSV